MIDVNNQIYSGKMSIDQTVTQFNYRIGIHQWYMNELLTGRTEYSYVGNIAFHRWAINGYKESIRHMTTKKWYSSKTLWINAAAIGAMVGEYLLLEQIYSPEIHALVIAVINLGLRFATKTAVTK